MYVRSNMCIYVAFKWSCFKVISITLPCSTNRLIYLLLDYCREFCSSTAAWQRISGFYSDLFVLPDKWFKSCNEVFEVLIVYALNKSKVTKIFLYILSVSFLNSFIYTNTRNHNYTIMTGIFLNRDHQKNVAFVFYNDTSIIILDYSLFKDKNKKTTKI